MTHLMPHCHSPRKLSGIIFVRDRSNARFTSIPRRIDLFMRRVCKAGTLIWIVNERWKEEAVVDQLLHQDKLHFWCAYQFMKSKRLCLCNKSIHGEISPTIRPYFTAKIIQSPSFDSTIILNLENLFCTTDVLTFFLRIFHPSRSAMTRGLVSRCQFFTWASEACSRKKCFTVLHNVWIDSRNLKSLVRILPVQRRITPSKNAAVARTKEENRSHVCISLQFERQLEGVRTIWFYAIPTPGMWERDSSFPTILISETWHDRL